MSGATRCLKCLVILCNCLVLAIGLVLLAGGIFLVIGSQEYVNKYTTEFVRSVEQKAGNGTNSKMNGGKSSPDFSSYTTPAGLVLIVFGAFITLLGLVGIFGVSCSSSTFLVIYAIVTILLITAEIVVTVLFFTNAFDARIRSQANYTLTEHYVGLMDLGPDSLAWNYIMIKLECCGLDNYEDFKFAKMWLRNEVKIKRDDLPMMNITQATPLACCKNATSLSSESDFVCFIYPTDETSNWQTGCWNEVGAVLLPYRTRTILIISAIFVAQALLALMALLIAWRLPSDRKNE